MALLETVNVRVKQALRMPDVMALTEKFKRGNLRPEVPAYVGGIAIRPSALGGRGVFASRKLQVGELLACEKPLFVSYDTTTSSFGRNQRSMSIMQQTAAAALANQFKARKLFDLSYGEAGLNDKAPWESEDR